MKEDVNKANPKRKSRKVRIIEVTLTAPVILLILFILFIILVVPNINTVSGENRILGAHRGNSRDYIENTLPAFKSALENDSYKFIEFDVQYTEDKVTVVHHDRSLLRVQEKIYWLKDMTFDELQNVSSYYIPTYMEVMDLIAGKKPLSIEIKSQWNFSDDKNLVDFLVKDLRERGVLNRTILSSLSSEVVRYIKENYPDIKVGKVYWVTSSTFLHFDSFTSSVYKEAEEIRADAIMLHGSNLRNFNSLESLLPKNITILIWYFDDEVYVINPNEDFAQSLKTTRPVFSFGKKKELCAWWC